MGQEFTFSPLEALSAQSTFYMSINIHYVYGQNDWLQISRCPKIDTVHVGQKCQGVLTFLVSVQTAATATNHQGKTASLTGLTVSICNDRTAWHHGKKPKNRDRPKWKHGASQKRLAVKLRTSREIYCSLRGIQRLYITNSQRGRNSNAMSAWKTSASLTDRSSFFSFKIIPVHFGDETCLFTIIYII